MVQPYHQFVIIAALLDLIMKILLVLCQLMLFGRVLTDGRLNARLKCDLTDNLTLKANAQVGIFCPSTHLQKFRIDNCLRAVTICISILEVKYIHSSCSLQMNHICRMGCSILITR